MPGSAPYPAMSTGITDPAAVFPYYLQSCQPSFVASGCGPWELGTTQGYPNTDKQSSSGLTELAGKIQTHRGPAKPPATSVGCRSSMLVAEANFKVLLPESPN